MISKFISFCYRFNCFIQSRRRVKNCYVVYSGRYDGVGAQVHAVLSIMLFAKKYNLQYLHSPVKNVEHNNKDGVDWSEKWEAFFSLGGNEMPFVLFPDVHVKELANPGLIYKRSNTVYKLNNCHAFTDLIPDEYNLLLKELKAKYYTEPKESLLKSGKGLQLAIHVRRGDVKSKTEKFNRYTSNEELSNRLAVLTGALRNRGLDFTVNIFSEGKKEDFEVLNIYSPNFYLNLDEFITFNSLVQSNILIMAKSSFSYVAALLSEGIVFYDPFWHKPLSNWQDITESPDKIERFLTVKLR